MKVYIRAANVADITAKIAKKQAEIDKKTAWIKKKEDNIQKKLDLLSGTLDDTDYNTLVEYLELLKNYYSHKLPDGPRVDTWRLMDKYGLRYEDKLGKALYTIDDDAKSIYNSKCAIREAEGVISNYNEKLSKEKAKGEILDNIPECLKDFMQDLIEVWDEYDINLRDTSKPYYKELRQKADDILYAGDPYHRYETARKVLEELYPDEFIHRRHSKFEFQYIEKPFKRRFDISVDNAQVLWRTSDEQIHADNTRAAKSIILEFLNRVTKITGPVIDWSGLGVTSGNNGLATLNGVVIGEDGKAKVESITAGGYNIQRLHIRTLVKEIK